MLPHAVSPGSKRHRMKITTIIISLVCLSQAALAEDLATPTPTPGIYPGRHGRAGTIRRQERQSAVDSRSGQRAKQKADRAAAATSQAQARQAARAREQAQREVAAQNHRETLTEKPRLTSDLMSRMGFSEKQIADQKAREQSAKGETEKKADPASPGQ